MEEYLIGGGLLALALALARRKRRPRIPPGAPISLIGDSYAEGLWVPLRHHVTRSGRSLGVRAQRGAGAVVVDWARDALAARPGLHAMVSVGANVGRSVWPPFEGGMDALAVDYPGRVWWILPPVGQWPSPVAAWQLRPPKVQLPDGVHPKLSGYERWAARIAELLL